MVIIIVVIRILFCLLLCSLCTIFDEEGACPSVQFKKMKKLDWKRSRGHYMKSSIKSMHFVTAAVPALIIGSPPNLAHLMLVMLPMFAEIFRVFPGKF